MIYHTPHTHTHTHTSDISYTHTHIIQNNTGNLTHMKKYNREKRNTYKAHNRKHTHKNGDDCGAPNSHKRIHIPIRYDGYNHTNYCVIRYGNTHKHTARTYVAVTNIINEICPEINAPHTARTHLGTAPYHRFIPQATDYMPPEDMMATYTYTYHDTRTAKCIIFDADGTLIHYGIFRRTIDIHDGTATITLHRGDRNIEVRPYIPATDTINGVPTREIRKHAEMYHL